MVTCNQGNKNDSVSARWRVVWMELTFCGQATTHGELTSLVGELDIQLPCAAPQHAGVIVGAEEYTSFVEHMRQAPVRPVSVSVYNHLGDLVVKYQAFRTFNRQSAPYRSTQSDRLATITLPDADALYLVLTSLHDIEHAPETQRADIWRADLEQFCRQRARVTLFVSARLDAVLRALGDYTHAFTDVHVAPDAVHALVLHLMGTPFHGCLQFDAPLEDATFTTASDLHSTVRPTQIVFTAHESARVRLTAVVRAPTIRMTELTTRTRFVFPSV